MAFQTLIVDREDRFAVITLNRPPANAINRALVEELKQALEALEPDPGIGAVILTGADRKSTRLNSSHIQKSRMPSSA